jgi:ribonuclease-3
MISFNQAEVEWTIGYHFRYSTLLKQAFTRSSYAKENRGESNEVLEFLGDKILDYVLTRRMITTWYGQLTPFWEFKSRLNEGQLTETRKKLVCRDMLSHRIDLLDLAPYLIMGKGDIQNHVEEDASVKEDLFEAILGAVAYDSSFNFETMDTLEMTMLDPERYLNNGFNIEKNAVSQLQTWFQRKGLGLPNYQYQDILLFFGEGFKCSLRLPLSPNSVSFSKQANNQSMARMEVAELAVNYLEENNL